MERKHACSGVFESARSSYSLLKLSLSFGYEGLPNEDYNLHFKGSVVVFGAWAHWTDDYKLHAEHPDEYNYCPHEPMMCAFVILLLKWVSLICLP